MQWRVKVIKPGATAAGFSGLQDEKGCCRGEMAPYHLWNSKQKLIGPIILNYSIELLNSYKQDSLGYLHFKLVSFSVELCPPKKKNADVLTPSTSERDLIWK